MSAFAKVGDTVYTPKAMWGSKQYCEDRFGGVGFYLPNMERTYVPAMTKVTVVAVNHNQNVLKTVDGIFIIDERVVR